MRTTIALFLTGASAVFDPYYGTVDQTLGIRPRVIVTRW